MAVENVRRRRRWILALLMTLGFAGVLSGVAVADPWGTGTGDTGPKPDANPDTYCYPTSSYDGRLPKLVIGQHVETIAWNVVNATTDVNVVSHDQQCVYSGTSETDVVWQHWDLPQGVRGRTRCDDITVSGTCDQAYLYMDMAEISIGSNDNQDADKTVCHEWGHALGLTHGGFEDCMINGERPSPSESRWERYSAHHRDHINAYF